jgi:dTDP-glucose pyrophosphorylase
MPKLDPATAIDQSILPFLVRETVSVKEAMRSLGKTGERILFVVDQENKLIGSLTDGDIRRWVLKEGELTSTIQNVFNREPIFFVDTYDREKIKKIMLENKIDGIPVVTKQKVVKEIILWNRVFGKPTASSEAKIYIPVVIMAGGKGKRLDPFTKVLPKPLIPIGDKAVIEVIMDKFSDFGVKEFYISINHKSRMIKAFFEEMNSAYRVSYIEEDKPLGTAGSLKYLDGKIHTDIFVSNCDIIIEADYAEVLDFHKHKNYDITIVGSFRHFVIPYGICTIGNGGTLVNIKEKPEYDFLVNTGMYIVKKEVLALIPKDEYFDFTDLINKAVQNKCKIGVFPIDEKSWTDIGQWEEYYKSAQNFKID